MARKKVDLKENPLFQGPTLEARRLSGSPYRELSIDNVDVDPEQPRRTFNEEALTQLSLSIKEHGVMSPIMVRLIEGGVYRIIAGERRYRASKMLGLKTIPAIVISSDVEKSDILSKQLVENLQRENLNPLERALAIGELKEGFKLSVREIASKVSLSKTSVQRSLEILSLPKDLQEALVNGASESKVLVLSKIKDIKIRKRILENLDSVTRIELEALVVELENRESEGKDELSHRGTPEQSIKSNKISIEDARIIEEIQKSIASKVELKRKGNTRQGKLIIEFYSDDDLDKLYRHLVS